MHPLPYLSPLYRMHILSLDDGEFSRDNISCCMYITSILHSFVAILFVVVVLFVYAVTHFQTHDFIQIQLHKISIEHIRFIAVYPAVLLLS